MVAKREGFAAAAPVRLRPGLRRGASPGLVNRFGDAAFAGKPRLLVTPRRMLGLRCKPSTRGGTLAILASISGCRNVHRLTTV